MVTSPNEWKILEWDDKIQTNKQRSTRFQEAVLNWSQNLFIIKILNFKVCLKLSQNHFIYIEFQLSTFGKKKEFVSPAYLYFIYNAGFKSMWRFNDICLQLHTTKSNIRTNFPHGKYMNTAIPVYSCRYMAEILPILCKTLSIKSINQSSNQSVFFFIMVVLSCLESDVRSCFLRIFFGQIFYFPNSASYFTSSGRFRFYNAN